MFDIISWQYLLLIAVPFLYCLYYRRFRFFALVDPKPNSIRNKIRRGKCPPSYPNGWYRLSRSDEMKAGVVHEIKLAGRHIAYYRGYDKIAYALHAYCPHMGANLGIGGQVKNGRCIECPFHGWRFDGKDGKCVNGDSFEPKKVTVCEYHDISTMEKQDNYIECGNETEVSLKKYFTREMNGLVYIWLHAKITEPQYEPFEEHIQNLTLRGESINYVNCHIQEIPENGADMRHFEYLHSSVMDILLPFLKFRWSMKTKNAADSDFYEVMKHSNKSVAEFQYKLFRKYLESDPTRKAILNVLSLDAEIIFFNKWHFYFLTATGFQTGPATVCLYVRSILFSVVYQQAIQPIDKFSQKVYHTIWTNSAMPYWMSAYTLYGELRQVIFDTVIWNSKIFSDRICYNLKSDADKSLLNWRNWYSQFYDGAAEYEQSLDKLEW